MKKLIGVLLAACLAAGVSGAAVFAEGAADQPAAITPMAWYRFEDAENFGKDSAGNYDLSLVNSATQDAIQIKEENGEKYLSLASVRDAEGEGGNYGACLYAPELDQSGKDFSDLVKYSYSVELTFRRDNSAWIGNHYVLAVGRYNNAFQITPWKGSIEIQLLNKSFAPGDTDEAKQQYLESHTTVITYDTKAWTTLLVSVSHVTKKAAIYINGELKTEIALPETVFTYAEDPYAFSLGAQCQITGTAATCYSTVDIKDCKVFDYALSAKNAMDLFEGKDSVYEGKYVQSLGEINTEGMDLLVTDTNTLEKIMTETLPKKVDVTLSDGSTVKSDVFWMTRGDKIAGYLSCQFANIRQLYLSVDYGYTVHFSYDPEAARISNVKLDGVAFTPDTKIDSGMHVVTFKVSPLENCQINSVTWYDMEQESDENGLYEVTFSGGANIVVDASKESFLITYYDGDKKLGTSEYTRGGSEGLKSFSKEGYDFEGWYSDAALTQKVTAPDYANPAPLTLYAKYVKQSSGGGEEGGSDGGCGCGSKRASAAAGGILLTVAAAVFVLKRGL